MLRRILRRAIRFAVKKLNAKPHFFSTLVDVVVDLLSDAFPEVKKNPQYVKDVINEEEDQFLKTLTRGQRLLEKTIAKLSTKEFPGEIAWNLYDTYGFPVDLTQLICEESGLFIDMNKFNEAKAQAQGKIQNATTQAEETILLDVHSIDELKSKMFLFTNDSAKYDYEADTNGNYTLKPMQATIKAIRYNKTFNDEVKCGQQCGLLLDQTSFYAEQGGQIFDEGYITKVDEDDTEFIVKNVQVRGGYILHVGSLTSSNEESVLKVGDKVNLHVDMARRRQVMNNHTGTHVLNFALRKVLSEADQRGSLVAPDKLRFDFSCKAAMKIEEIRKVEEICQEVVDKKLGVYGKEAPLALAKSIQGLRAVFDETYPDPVRIVSVGKAIEDLIADPNGPAAFENSVEFCGGTHLLNSAHIEKFLITDEDAIAKGIRRIIAITGAEAIKAGKKADELERDVSELAKEVSGMGVGELKNLTKKINALSDEVNQAQISCVAKDAIRNNLKNLKKTLDDLDKKEKAQLLAKAMDETKELIAKIKAETPELKFIVKEFNVNGDAKSLNNIITQFKTALPSTCCMFFSVDPVANKILCLSSVPDVRIL